MGRLSIMYLNPTPTPNIGDQVKNERHFLVSLALLSKMFVRGSLLGWNAPSGGRMGCDLPFTQNSSIMARVVGRGEAHF